MYLSLRKLITSMVYLPSAMAHLSRALQDLQKDSSAIRVLDLGYGDGSHWQTCDEGTLAGIEVTAFDVVEVTNSGPSNLFLKGIAPSGLAELDTDSYDVVIAWDLIEHLPKHEGYWLLYEMERIASKLAAIYTPNGFLWQPAAQDNPWQMHLSGWSPGELRNFGWGNVYGTIGAKSLFGPYASPRYLGGSRMFYLLSLPLNQIGRLLPELAFSFVALKKI